MKDYIFTRVYDEGYYLEQDNATLLLSSDGCQAATVNAISRMKSTNISSLMKNYALKTLI
jgi:hypothetical protein